jgi:hypothetical protein
MEARFLSHVEKTEDCWLWTGTTSRGYGKFWVNGKMDMTHRVAYELWNGPIPDGLCVRHKCRNTHCVNPEHLETGTCAENQRDRIRDGTDMRGEKHRLAKLTADQVVEIRNRVNQSYSEIANEFGVSPSLIGLIVRRKQWTHI